MIFESRKQCPRVSGTFIYTSLTLTKVLKDFLEIRFLYNLGRSSDIMSNSMKL